MRGISAARLLLVSLVVCTNLFGQATLKRGRNEGTTNIPASNAIGNGNITVYAGGVGGYGTIGTVIDPTFAVCVGVASIIQMSGKTSFTNFKGLGTSEAHLQLTTPGNDRLRFFGIALSGDLYLPTIPDTISASSASGKPEYGSFMFPSAIIDLDWLALIKTLPLKTYVAAGLADDPTLLYRYDQVSVKTGFEWKMYQSSGFLDIGAGLYKEKVLGSFAGDASYLQRVLWFEPGVRYRFFGRYSLLGSLRITAYRALKDDRPLPTTLIRGSAIFDIPLLFRETNTEAIRTLVFMEQKKEQTKDSVARNIELGRRVDGDLEKELNSLNMKSDGVDPDKEKDALQQREAIQQKLDDLEKLLDETP